ncbi:alpha-E domain-containing protein [Pseudaestuariivita rosea]|uniref:alpha-E domain-containing protein n=1 Tax=Pseudaestuariivita rosea TaxID=2763263 RepID=UPI001ABB08B9|nr:alpha-E domain-containing protein [Pseudaestuariivita rosea]
MLGKTAGGLFWMFRSLERSENTARLIETGFRIALTRPGSEEWASVLKTAAADQAYTANHGAVEQSRVINFLLRDPGNPSSVMSSFSQARQNARIVRTAITREVWEAVNDAYVSLKDRLARPVPERDLPDVLAQIRQHSALVRGTLHGSMLRNDMFDFCRLGTFLERADNTARILDVKYYVLLPSVMQVGSSLDNVQWETILRSVSGVRAYNRLNHGKATPMGIADFLIFDPRMPRSLRYSVTKILSNLRMLHAEYSDWHACHDTIERLDRRLTRQTVEEVFEEGLHEFLTEFLAETGRLGAEIETDFKFTE